MKIKVYGKYSNVSVIATVHPNSKVWENKDITWRGIHEALEMNGGIVSDDNITFIPFENISHYELITWGS